MFAPMMQYRDPGNPFSDLTPDEIRRRVEYERNNPDEFQQTIMPVPTRSRPMLTDMRARRPIGGVTPVPRTQPFQPQPFQPQPFQPQPFQPKPAPPQFGQVEEQPQLNQQGMQQMMQMMQQMMQMISQFSNQGGFGGGFGGGFNQLPPMFGGGFGQGGYQQPRQRPMPMPNMFGRRGRRQFEMQYGFDGRPIGMGPPTNRRTFA